MKIKCIGSVGSFEMTSDVLYGLWGDVECQDLFNMLHWFLPIYANSLESSSSELEFGLGLLIFIYFHILLSHFLLFVFIVGFYAAVGVPLAGLGMASFATKLLAGMTDKIDSAEAMLNEPVTQTELDMMTKCGLEDGDGNVDRGEFVICIMSCFRVEQ
jgi:hypothetical protein